MGAVRYKITLDWSGKKLRCPQCGKQTFVGYRDRENGEYTGAEFGRCDREIKCGYFRTPDSEKPTIWIPQQEEPQKIYFPSQTFEKCRTGYDVNSFYLAATKKGINAKKLTDILNKYRCGTLTKGDYNGAICYPIIDRYGNIHSVQIKTFKPDFHTDQITWLHSILKKCENPPKWVNEYSSQTLKTGCFFGEHLLRDKQSPVIIVESPKNAILGSIMMPDYIWLASVSLSMLSVKKMRVLKGRKVVLIPDTSKDSNAFEIWQNVAAEAEKLYQTTFTVNRFLEDNVTEDQKSKGYDIGDYIIDSIGSVTPEPQQPPKQYEEYTREERLQCGLTAFADADLKQLAQRLFAEKKEMRWSALSERLQELESLGEQETEDLLDVLSIKKIIKYDTDTYLYSI